VRTYDSLELVDATCAIAGLRNSLTTLGIGVGVASLVAMLSLRHRAAKAGHAAVGRSGLFDTVCHFTQDSRGGRFTAVGFDNRSAQAAG